MSENRIKNTAETPSQTAEAAVREQERTSKAEARTAPETRATPECRYTESMELSFTGEAALPQSIWRSAESMTSKIEAPAETATIRVEAEILRIAEVAGISAKKVPELLELASSERIHEKVARHIERNLTIENLDKWLTKENGKRWLARNRGAVAETFKERVRLGAPGLAISVVSLLGAMEIADIVGISAIHQPQEHFACVIATMHVMSTTGHAAGSRIYEAARGNVKLLPTLSRVLDQRIVAGEGGKVLELTITSRGTIGRAITNALKANFAGGLSMRTAVRGGATVLKLPFKAARGVANIAYGIGPGLLSCAIADTVLPEDMDLDTRSAIGFGAFFIPDALRIATGMRGVKLARGLGLKAASRLAGLGFLIDLGIMGIQRMAMGDAMAYHSDIAARATEGSWADAEDTLFRGALDTPWYTRWLAVPGALIAVGLGKVTHALMPSAIDAARLAGSGMNDDGEFDRKVARLIDRDVEDSRLIQRYDPETNSGLPVDVLTVLLSGVGDERDTAEFYKELSFDSLTDEVDRDDAEELEERIEELRADPAFAKLPPQRQDEMLGILAEEYAEESSIMTAHSLQQTMAALHFMHVPVNDKFRRMVDEDGVLLEDYEDDGMEFRPGEMLLEIATEAMPQVEDADTARVAILELRRRDLIRRSLGAEGEERARLASLAREVGLIDERGRWEPTPTYFAALHEWKGMAAQDDEEGERLATFVKQRRREYHETEDVGDRNVIEFELAVLGRGLQMAEAGVRA